MKKKKEKVRKLKIAAAAGTLLFMGSSIFLVAELPLYAQGPFLPSPPQKLPQGTSPFSQSTVPPYPQPPLQTQVQKQTVSPSQTKKESSPCGENEYCPLSQPEGKESVSESQKEKEVKPQKERKEKVKKEEPHYVPLPKSEMTEGKVVEGIYYVVTPEKTTMVQMSNVDINRIVCPVPVQDVVFSEEKGIEVKVVDRNVFVKFKVKKIDETLEYSTTPVDIHVVCAGKVYSIVAFPRKIPAVLVYLEDKKGELEEKVSPFSGMAFEEKIAALVKSFFSGRIPRESEFVPSGKKYALYKDLVIEEKGKYVFEGEGLVVRYFIVSYTGKEKPQIDLSERLFLKKELTVSPVAVSLEKLKLKSGETTSLLIIETKQEKSE